MNLLHFWSLAVLLASPSDAAQLCGATGLSKQLPYFTSSSSSLNYAAACGKHCAADSKCQSYAIGTNLCLHYKVPVSGLFIASSSSPWKLYDRICAPYVAPAPSPGQDTSPNSPTDAVPAPTGTANADVYNGGVVTAGALATTDSPPLPSSDVQFPTGDKSFTVTYTYQDDPLPTIEAMGTAPAPGLPMPTSGLPNLPCVIDPSSTNSQFNILGSNFVPLVSAAGNKLQPLPAPTSEAQANAMGPPDSVVLPAFFFQKSASAPAGVYDLVMAGNKLQYVAKAANGGLILTSASTGATAKNVNGQSIVTSIFSIDCKGRFSVKQGNTAYTWDIAANGQSTSFTPGLSSSNKTMVAYSLQMKTKPSRKQRRSIYTDGAAPRCPNTPPDLIAKVFPGARGLAPNGCGAANGVDFVPDFSFGKCCDGHDNCFDDCDKGTFEGCNDQFHSCMRGQGCDYLNHWYSFVPYLSCLKAADFYAWSVGTSIGRDAFKAATEERCKCYCKDNQAICMPGGSARCTNLFTSDASNCGACERTCSAKSVCRTGTCSCPNDQCGDRCVSLKDNPNNCGRCGHRCGTGEACYQGQCYLPPPDKCAPVEGFSDGGSPQTWQITDKKNDGFTCPICPYYTGAPTDTWKIAKDGYGAIGTTVHMCPDTDYDLSFQTRHGDGINVNSCKMKYKFGNRDWSSLQGVPTGGPTYEKYTGSPNYRIPRFQKGEGGTTLNGLSLDVPFQAYMTCDGETFAMAINYFSLVPAS